MPEEIATTAMLDADPLLSYLEADKLATAALRALDEAGYVLTKVSVVTDPRDFLSTPPEGLRTIGDKPFGRA